MSANECSILLSHLLFCSFRVDESGLEEGFLTWCHCENCCVFFLRKIQLFVDYFLWLWLSHPFGFIQEHAKVLRDLAWAWEQGLPEIVHEPSRCTLILPSLSIAVMTIFSGTSCSSLTLGPICLYSLFYNEHLWRNCDKSIDPSIFIVGVLWILYE